MQNQIPADCRLRFQCLLYGADSQIAGNVSVRNARHHAAVVQVNYRTIVSYTTIFQKNIGKVSSPFLVTLLCLKILIKQIVKHLMCSAFLIIWLFTPDNGMKIQLLVHIVMNSVSTEMNLLPSQKYLHTAITIYAIMFMVYRCDFPEHKLFLGAINRLPVFQEIVVGVRADPQFTQ